jgi:tRNA threonylcarbamoyladenosine biosynthesis protein TsaE
MSKYISKSEKETEKIAGKLAKKLKGGEVIGLIGDLGTGKTVFVRGLAISPAQPLF